MNRYSGVLMSVSSLPSPHGIGCFDKAAYAFVDWLERTGQRYWQILPLGATSHEGASDSPYQAWSAFAGNPYFISLDALVEEGVLTPREVAARDFGSDPNRVDFALLHKHRLSLLRKAYARSDISRNPEYQAFLAENRWWLDDYSLFMALKDFFGGVMWTQWPQDIRMRYGYALDYYREKLYFDIEFQTYLQFQFFRQWSKLKKYANDRHIQILGDIPIYVSPDSSDVWAKPEMFQLDENNAPVHIAGCPPDGFAPEGQVWGNPLYRWDHHRSTGYEWWCSRMWYSYRLYDVVRIDHFRGFDEYFAIPADTGLAREGHWQKGPGLELFRTLEERLGALSVIAEDLGHMTASVKELVANSGYPNMKVLQFAFDAGDEGGVNEYLPHNYSNNCVVYTGTHDNETISGWFSSLPKAGRDQIRDYLMDHATPIKRMHLKLIATALGCAADTCIIPIQDWLGLGNTARMNTPGTVGINWSWRLAPDALTPELEETVLTLTKRYGRANWDALKEEAPTQDLPESNITPETPAP